ncbi:FKBP-type peptidyl-prolyl cis-trans isomerase [Demequina gelatinilytica]|uniref:FKBP-type peptidyl-prolyl cis-trans isomerase n=1 Tax=Demequina gelatinilytica TaxID=1638980 RepID=UPI0007814ABA|nr:FKBP-type peptidyl-prolyl cis-trans isomerase [Demequina gelatinilytica]
MKKNKLAAVALGSVAMLGLAACSPASDADPSPSASAAAESQTSEADLAALSSIEWADADGIPELTFESPLTVGDTALLHVADGDGEVIEEGQQVVLDYVVYTGSDASVYYSTYDTGMPEAVPMEEGQVIDELYTEIVGANVGDQFLYAFPDTSSEDVPTRVMAVTASAAVSPLERAEGASVDAVEGLPTVTLDDTGAPSIDFSGAKKPSELVSQTLIEGDGETVEKGDLVWVNYSGWVWKGEDTFDSSWGTGSSAMFRLTSDQLIEGWVQGLEGVTVGSQVLVIVPPDLGYGDQDLDAIPAGSTLAFVVDVVAAA